MIDLSLSPNYRKGHIPGAWFAIRSRLAQALPKIPLRGELVLTSEDGVLAGLAVPEARALTGHPVRYLDGRQRGVAGGRAIRSRPSRSMADDPVDVWLKPYERAGDTTGAMNEYLSWEVDLRPAHRARRHLQFQSRLAPRLLVSRSAAFEASARRPDLARRNTGASFSTSAGPKCACGLDGVRLSASSHPLIVMRAPLKARCMSTPGRSAAIEEGIAEIGPLASGRAAE